MSHQAFQPLRERAFQFAVDVVLFCRTLPASWEGRRIADQLFRSGTAVGANYSAASQGRSPKEFIAKLGTVVEESDESCFWLRLIEATKIPAAPVRTRLAKEAKELLLIFGASLATAKRNRANRKKAKRKVGRVDPMNR
jgi:four helix bundle protein